MARNRTQRLILFNSSPYCRKCGDETFLFSDENGNLFDNCATVQHNLPKSHPNYKNDITLWCYKCNQEDAIYKQTNRIFSREELLHHLLGANISLNGYYLIDNVLCSYRSHTLIKEIDIIDYKFGKLKEYMVHSIDDSFFIFTKNGKKVKLSKKPTFKEFLNIKGTYSFKRYYIGNGWYHYIPPNETQEFRDKIQSRMDEIKAMNPAFR